MYVHNFFCFLNQVVVIKNKGRLYDWKANGGFCHGSYHCGPSYKHGDIRPHENSEKKSGKRTTIVNAFKQDIKNLFVVEADNKYIYRSELVWFYGFCPIEI